MKKFYCDDENSSVLPDKDYASVGRKQHIQKRLILSNLKQLYDLLIKEKNPAVKFKFSELCTLRPCGTHSVCVCTHHQNVVLLLNAIKVYHKLIEMIVCDRDSKEYMVFVAVIGRQGKLQPKDQ